jgi:hypothetical protein
MRSVWTFSGQLISPLPSLERPSRAPNRVLGGASVAVSGDGKQESNSNINAGVIAGSVIGVAALVVFVVMFLLWYRRTSKLKRMACTCLVTSILCRRTHVCQAVIPVPVESRTSPGVESPIPTKRDRFLASLAARDMEERVGGFGASRSSQALTSRSGVNPPQQSASSTAASNVASQQSGPERTISPGPPPYQP